MNCNGWNHPPNCTCGWGGVFYSAGSDDLALQWPLRGGGWLNPNASFPTCKKKVFFYRSPNGGSAYFDALGAPWPKHPCMVDGTLAALPISAYWEAISLLDRIVKKAPPSVLLVSTTKVLDWVLERASTAVNNGRVHVAVAYWVASLPQAALGQRDIELQAVTQDEAYAMALCVANYLGDGKSKGPRRVAKALASQVIQRATDKQARNEEKQFKIIIDV